MFDFKLIESKTFHCIFIGVINNMGFPANHFYKS